MYVSRRHDELRFGASVERAFEVVRAEVDSRIAALVPNALGMLAAAFENAASANPEHWANAASTCRRLLKEAADALRAPGEPVILPSGTVVKAGPDNHVKRLALWIDEQATSDIVAEMVKPTLSTLAVGSTRSTKPGRRAHTRAWNAATPPGSSSAPISSSATCSAFIRLIEKGGRAAI